MRTRIRAAALLLALLMALSSFVFTANAAGDNDGTSSTQRVVSVLYDNSGSMKDPVNNADGDTTWKNHYAKYALKMLASLLGEEDLLYISPLNGADTGLDGIDLTASGGLPTDVVSIDLSDKDREKAINKAFTSSGSFLSRDPSGLTPGPGPMRVAMKVLTEKGLKDKDSLTMEQDDTEHWLVILSDGEFDNYKNKADTLVGEYITNYPTLKTIFIGFGSGAPDLTASKLADTYPFTPYRADTSEEIIEVMQSVANQLSGRCALDSTVYTASGNTVTVDLGECKYAIKSVSIIAQNCGAKLSSVKYNGSGMSYSLSSVIGADNIMINNSSEMKAGYSAVVNGDPYFYGGTLEFVFDSPVSNVSVMVEPALRVETYLEYLDGDEWVRADMQYINSNMLRGDKIRAGFEVYEQATGQMIDLANVFGKVESSVTYAGREGLEVGKPFELETGNNTITISVSVLDGAYQIYSSTPCIIEENLDDYRVEGVANDQSVPGKLLVDMEYTVYAKGIAVDSAGLAKYKTKAVLVSPSGDETELKCTVKDGKVLVNAKLTSGEYGDYLIKFEVTNEDNLSRAHKKPHKTSFCPEQIKLNVKGTDVITVSQHGITKNTTPFVFEIDTMPFESAVLKYELTVDGKPLTPDNNNVTVNGKTLTYIPTAEDFGGTVSLGDKKVSLHVYCPDFPTVTDVAETTLSVQPIAYTLIPVDSGDKTVDRFNIKESNAALCFKVDRDGDLLSLDEITATIDEFKFSDPGVFSWCFWFASGYEVTPTMLNGEAVVEYRVVRERLSILGVNFMSMFISSGDKEVKVEYKGARSSDAITFTESEAFDYIWRIIVFILVAYLLAWLAGFLVARSLPKGVLVKVDPKGINKKVLPSKKINLKFKDKLIWHLSRLLPHKLWSHQKMKYGFNGIRLVHVDKYDTTKILLDKPKKDEFWLRANVKSSAKAKKEIDNFVKMATKGKSYKVEATKDDIDSAYKVSFKNKIIFATDTKDPTANLQELSEVFIKYDDKKGIVKTIVFFKEEEM